VTDDGTGSRLGVVRRVLPGGVPTVAGVRGVAVPRPPRGAEGPDPWTRSSPAQRRWTRSGDSTAPICGSAGAVANRSVSRLASVAERRVPAPGAWVAFVSPKTTRPRAGRRRLATRTRPPGAPGPGRRADRISKTARSPTSPPSSSIGVETAQDPFAAWEGRAGAGTCAPISKPPTSTRGKRVEHRRPTCGRRPPAPGPLSIEAPFPIFRTSPARARRRPYRNRDRRCGRSRRRGGCSISPQSRRSAVASPDRHRRVDPRHPSRPAPNRAGRAGGARCRRRRRADALAVVRLHPGSNSGPRPSQKDGGVGLPSATARHRQGRAEPWRRDCSSSSRGTPPAAPSTRRR